MAINLRIVSETDEIVVIGWDDPGHSDLLGFEFLRDGQVVSRTLDPNRRTVKFGKKSDSHVFGVREITRGHSGFISWPEQPPLEEKTMSAWRITLEPNNHDYGTDLSNRYTAYWLTTKRDDAPNPVHKDSGWISFDKYPDGVWAMTSRRFDLGHPGRSWNWHVMPPWEDWTGPLGHNGVSPIALDWHGSLPSYHPGSPDLPDSFHLTLQGESDEYTRRAHWPLVLKSEIEANRTKWWHFVMWVRFGRVNAPVTPLPGAVKIWAFREDGSLLRSHNIQNVNTIYEKNVDLDRQQYLGIWNGGYDSSGVSTAMKVSATLECRGHTVDEMFSDSPILGGTWGTVAKPGANSSSYTPIGEISVPIGRIRETLLG